MGSSPRQLLREGELRLNTTHSPRICCEWVLSELLDTGRTALYLEERTVPQEVCQKYFQIINAIREGHPSQYLVGKASFMGDEFWVTPDCFIPRPETEVLVEACLDYFQRFGKVRAGREKGLLWVDIGTGSGCIAISLTKRSSCSKMLAIDLVEKTLRVARQNGQQHGVSDRILWVCGDLFGPLPKGFEADAIVSNPPYIPSGQMDFLPPEVRREPRMSLEGGESGLHFYERIAEEVPPYLAEEGFLFLEIGDYQEAPVRGIFSESAFRLLEVRNDLCGRPRVMIFQKGFHG
ncbi:MAG: peptide chain release factor N(5)-glutamine methyltransferase [Candidatus Omnitrophota bacterium]